MPALVYSRVKLSLPMSAALRAGVQHGALLHVDQYLREPLIF